MKLTVIYVFVVLSLAAARLHDVSVKPHKKHSASARNWRLTALHGAGGADIAAMAARKQAQQRKRVLAEAPALYGSPKCPCVGLDNIPGSTDVIINGTEINYPADLGARCNKWSVDRNKACKGDNQPAWCPQPWCYVDPCNCDLEVQPKHSMLLPDAIFKGKPVYYSYTTCGGEDLYTAAENKGSCSMQKTEEACKAKKGQCSWKDKCINQDMMMCKGGKPDESQWGLNSCPCVGVSRVPGTIDMKAGNVQVKGGLVQYPADTGATCETWDNGRSPECAEGGTDNPPWCETKWCYVDPCNCKTPGGKVPTVAHLLEGAIFQGKPAYYSFATCGNEDLWTAENFKDACKLQTTEEGCSKQENDCAWTGTICEGWDIDSVCEAFHAQKEEVRALTPEGVAAEASAGGAGSEAKGAAGKQTAAGQSTEKSAAMGSTFACATSMSFILLANAMYY